jgi:hypothetical protein
VNHEEFAERASRRLKEVADRLEVEGKDLRIAGEASKITARAQELRVVALLVREEALAVSKTIAPPPKNRRPWPRTCSSKLRPSAGPSSAGHRAVPVSQEASYVNGETLGVTGGPLCHI